MTRRFTNVYEDDTRAASYAALEYPATYWLAFRDLPALLAEHVRGPAALDFGCGAGRSTRFLKAQGYEACGVDISPSMLAHARQRDPEGRYLQVPNGDLSALGDATFDLVFSAFTFDNVPEPAVRARLFGQFFERLKPGGRMLNLVSAPEIYRHEWTSFSTKDFPGDAQADSGDRVRIVMLDVPDRRPVEDVLWQETDYRALATDAGFEVLTVHRPLGRDGEPHDWVSEREVSPWAIHVLGK